MEMCVLARAGSQIKKKAGDAFKNRHLPPLFIEPFVYLFDDQIP